MPPAALSRDDLERLGDLIGEASIVGLTEAAHCAREPLDLRNQLFEYLIRKKGFTAIAIESGLVESRKVYDYVRGADGTVRKALAEGIGWTFDALPQNKILIGLLRRCNSSRTHPRKINFYGFDIPGSPGNPYARRGVDTALRETLKYLKRADSAAAAAFHARVRPLLKDLRFNLYRSSRIGGYHRLTRGQRDCLTATIEDLIEWIKTHEQQCIAATGHHDYEWGYRSALGARQVDRWVRQIPQRWQPSKPDLTPGKQNRFLSVANDVRDRAQVDNLKWILEREGPSGKVLVYASRYHLSTAPVTTAWWSRSQEVAGTYLRRRFGGRFLVIGNLIGGGEWGNAQFFGSVPRARSDSLEGALRELRVPCFCLDIRRAPTAVAKWLDRSHELGQGPDALSLNVRRAFDVLLYMERISRAARQ